MFKSSIIISLLLMSKISYSAGIDCSGLAMQKATAFYSSEASAIQGSNGPSAFVELELHAKKPFYNFIVGVSDNNEDGETWTNYYFVMTKFENNKCNSIKVNQTEEAALKISSYYDFENQVDLKAPKDFVLNRKMLSEYKIGFKTLIDPDASICYFGDSQWALDIVESVLYYDSGDSAILNSIANVTNGRIIHYGTYTEGSGDNDYSLDFEIDKCK